jgi:hypothetical protein
MAKAKRKSLWDTYRFASFTPSWTLDGLFVDPKARVLSLTRRLKKTACGVGGTVRRGGYDQRARLVRDRPCGDYRIYLRLEVRRVDCRKCGGVKREGLKWLLDSPFCSKRFGYHIGRKCRSQTIRTWPGTTGSIGTRSRSWTSGTWRSRSGKPENPPPGSSASARSQ